MAGVENQAKGPCALTITRVLAVFLEISVRTSTTIASRVPRFVHPAVCNQSITTSTNTNTITNYYYAKYIRDNVI